MSKDIDINAVNKAFESIAAEDLESAIDNHEILDEELNKALLSAVDKSVMSINNAEHQEGVISENVMDGFSEQKIREIISISKGSGEVSEEVFNILMQHMPKNIDSENKE